MPTKISIPDPEDSNKIDWSAETTVSEEQQVKEEDPEFPDTVIEDEEETSIAVEDLDPESEIWPGGPTAGQVIGWKEQYGMVVVTSVTYDKHIAWRPLNRVEYRNLVKHVEQLISSGKMTQAEANMENEEIICEICCLYPRYSKQDFARELAGLPSILSQQILESSGFTAWDIRGM